LIKQRLLLRELAAVENWEAHVEIMRAADLASQTAFPALLFPSLFEECVGSALKSFRDREAAYWEKLLVP
jgi:hypothetical protein